jgi:TetR/AcrR family transcriptional regulator, cholesterol catabolism regulator
MSSGRRERNKEEKRQRIFSSARELFFSQGFDTTTTREIAERAEVGTGTVFLYARSKEELLFYVIRDDIEQVFSDAFSTTPSLTPLLDRLIHIFGFFFDYYATCPDLAKRFVLLSLFPIGEQREAYQELNQIFFKGLLTQIERSQHRGEIRQDLDVIELCRNIFAIYAYHVIEWLDSLEHRPNAGRNRLREAFTLMLEGVHS